MTGELLMFAAGALTALVGKRIGDWLISSGPPVLRDTSHLEGVAFCTMRDLQPSGFRFWDAHTGEWLPELPGEGPVVEGFELTTSKRSYDVTVAPGKVYTRTGLVRLRDPRNLHAWQPGVILYVDVRRAEVHEAYFDEEGGGWALGAASPSRRAATSG